MSFKFKTVIISTLSLSSSLTADNEAENPIPRSATTTFYEDSLRETHKRLQDIHHFESTFDDSGLGGIPYESFN